jgi:bifunctional non-homologous end joining protein LigD
MVPVLPSIHPIRLRVTKQPFDSPDYIFELKHDGFRAIAYIEKRKCHLVSRNLNQFKFETLQEALSTLPVKNAILDGEVVCLDDRGVSQFTQLLRRECDPAFYAFDLLWLNGKDYRGLPLVDRKARLEKLLKSSKSERILYAQHIERGGKEIFAEVCSRDLEGIVAKRKLGTYKDSARNWLKIKNPTYTQSKDRHELLTHSKK